MTVKTERTSVDPLEQYVPPEFQALEDPQRDLPRIAKTPELMALIESSLEAVDTSHDLHLGDAREMRFLQPNSVHLVVTSPPYWALKEYRESENQLGFVADYEEFLQQIDHVWMKCFDALVPGGRLICVVGDVCLSRRKNNGRHAVIPLHAAIQEHCRGIGYVNVAPIIWSKIANASHEVEGGSAFLGKPYEPNAVIKNDIEFILMQKKPGGYRKPTLSTRILSLISEQNHRIWFQQIWSGVTGASTRSHPAPYPTKLAERLIRMFSFVGDTVLDPFMGTGTTIVAAAKWGRNSIGVEVDPVYFDNAARRIRDETASMFAKRELNINK